MSSAHRSFPPDFFHLIHGFRSVLHTGDYIPDYLRRFVALTVWAVRALVS